jgi:hypothetical protein
VIDRILTWGLVGATAFLLWANAKYAARAVDRYVARVEQATQSHYGSGR